MPTDARAEAAAGPTRFATRYTLGWASGATGQAIAYYAFSVLLLRYLTDTVGLTGAVAGILIGGSKLFDAVVDPMIGARSDDTRSRFGRRVPWMFVGGLLLGGSIAMLFNTPTDATSTSKQIWVAAGLIVYSLGFGCFSIPWLAMPAEITTDYHGRSTMMACRVFASAAGQGIGAVGAALILSTALRTSDDYATLGWMLGALAAVGTVLTAVVLNGAPATVRETAARPPLLRQARMVLENRPFLIILVMKFCGFSAATMQAGAMAYFTTYVLELPDTWLASFYLALTAGMIASQPIWLKASRRFDKKRTVGVAYALQMIFYLTLSLGLFDEGLWLVGHGVLLGVSIGGIFQLTQSMLPDTLEHDYHRTGMRREGALTGIGAFVEKSSSALGIAAIGLLLSATGYVVQAGGGAVQPPAALLAISFGASFGPALLMLVSLLALQGYRLGEQDLEAARRQ